MTNQTSNTTNKSKAEPTFWDYAIIITIVAVIVIAILAFVYGTIGSIFTSIFGIEMGIVPTIGVGIIVFALFGRWNKNRNNKNATSNESISSRGHVSKVMDDTSSRGHIVPSDNS